jgi:mannose-6-phosphate isomerase-like protein (cupin superfamily)
MSKFETMQLPAELDAIAPVGSDVRVLLRLDGCSLAHFELGPGQVSKAMKHRTVDEIWYVLRGRGRMWRECEGQEETVDLAANVCLTIPQGTRFQFRSFGYDPLSVIGVTMPPWPLDRVEADPAVGVWEPSERWAGTAASLPEV